MEQEPDKPIEKLLYSRKEAAQSLGVSDRKVDKLVIEGRIKPTRIDSRVMFHIDDLRKFVADCRK